MQTAMIWLGRTRRGEAVEFFWQWEIAKLPLFRTLLMLLVGADVALILVHVLHKSTGLFVRQFFSIEFEDGYGDFYQALKQAWVAIVLWRLGVIYLYRHFGVWAALFGYVMLDDFFAIHETVGYQLVTRVQLPSMLGLRSVDFGEIFVLAVVGLIFLPLLITTYRAGAPLLRRDARTLVALLGVLAMFGVGADLLHSLLSTTPLVDAIGTVEDGGEMVVTSVLLWFTILALARNTFSMMIPRTNAVNG